MIEGGGMSMEYNDLTKPASEVTRQVHQQMKSLLDFEDAHEKTALCTTA